ncbi:hypothetical protein SAMN04490248_11421 [Salinihabitans flavidus]|uniref:Cellulose biosynthesis protein BcsS n=1 Tax=Salinihabitans flavidus TaxID=569882 RepID=A0A1H8T3X1_9RHOB|nr:cellulose biosynthesis protein BcsS [Salinihabitans flavidus]SEO85334.1 hypothetical protein SAMN04490248_11421 [Salinihabitans flavidus]
MTSKNQNGRGLTATWLLAFAATIVVSGSASAQTNAANDVVDTVVFWGLDYARNDSSMHDIGLGAGFVTSLGNDMSAGGWTLSAYFSHSNSTTLGGSTNMWSGWSSLGHVWQLPGGYFTLGAGFAAEEGQGFGGFAQYGFETTAANALYLQSYGSFSGINDSIYALGRAGYMGQQYRYGIETVYLDDNTAGQTLRYGVFMGGIDLGRDVSMIASLGYQDESQPGRSDGFYTAIGFSIPLSLR